MQRERKSERQMQPRAHAERTEREANEVCCTLPAREVLQDSIQVAENGDKIFDFDDMIYMPVLRDLVKPSQGLVIVDECQVQSERERARARGRDGASRMCQFFLFRIGHGLGTCDNGATSHRQRAPAASRGRESGAVNQPLHARLSCRCLARSPAPSSVLPTVLHLSLKKENKSLHSEELIKRPTKRPINRPTKRPIKRPTKRRRVLHAEEAVQPPSFACANVHAEAGLKVALSPHIHRRSTATWAQGRMC